MSNFKTHTGGYKGLVILVRSYSKIIWSYRFYQTNEEYEGIVKFWAIDDPAQPDALYCFNKEKPLKEQAQYARNTVFGEILQNVIKKELVDKRW